MSDFKWGHFRGETILGCVRWYGKYGISYRDPAEIMVSDNRQSKPGCPGDSGVSSSVAF